jgi:tetratricopeptide (TPR) repeat protein
MAIKLKPDYWQAYFQRAQCKKQLSDHKGELEDYNMAIEFKQDYESAYYERGIAKYEMGDKFGGCEDLNKAMRFGSDQAYYFIVNHCK